MTTALQTDVLVLNKNWAALRIITAAEALADLFVGRVEAVETDYQAYDFASWHDLSAHATRFQPEGRDFVKTVSSAVLVPAVVRLLRFDRVHRPVMRLSRQNVYLRDNYTCQYTGQKLPASRLNLDHVIPSSQGGRTTWNNLVCCAVDVNSQKGGRTPAQAGLTLIRKPRRPDPAALMFKGRRPRPDRTHLPCLPGGTARQGSGFGTCRCHSSRHPLP